MSGGPESPHYFGRQADLKVRTTLKSAQNTMSHSGRARHRDHRDARRRDIENEPPMPGRVFRMTDDHRHDIAKNLRFIDEARRVLESQQNPENREIIRELRASADRIYTVINELEEIDASAT
jgi:hypothetical protein